jgi:hypothetical protein
MQSLFTFLEMRRSTVRGLPVHLAFLAFTLFKPS